jgi:hypothetical protein
LPYCKNCGSEMSEDRRYCPKCGAPFDKGVSKRRRGRRRRRDDDLCFGRESDRDPLDLLEFGLFLLVVGAVFLSNPSIPAELVDWVTLMADLSAPIRPQASLISSATLFFGLIGLSNLFTAVARVLMDKVWRRILPDLLAGTGFLALTYLVSLYAKEAITFTNVIAVEAIVFGISVVLYAVLRDMF